MEPRHDGGRSLGGTGDPVSASCDVKEQTTLSEVLVVEDDESILHLVVTHLRKQGHRVVGVTSGQAALELVRQKHAPDVAVLDIGLPDMDGRELLSDLRERMGAFHLPAIFLTGKIEEDDVRSGRALGALYLTKPVVLSALSGAIARSVPTEHDW